MKGLIERVFMTTVVFSIVTFGLSLSGCSGRGVQLSSQVVSGTAAGGAPLAGQVNLKDSSTTPQIKSTVIGSDGTFAIDVTDMQAPFILQATGSFAGSNYKLHSFSAGTGTANINPLSDVIVASAAGDIDASVTYDNSDRDKLNKIGSNLQTTVDALLTKLQPLLQQYNAQNINPITDHYVANHLNLDEMFDNVKITLINRNVTLYNAISGAVIFTASITDIANGVLNGDTMPQPPAVPSAPTGLSATAGSGQVILAWAAVSNATVYNVYFSTSPGVSTANGTKIQVTNNSYVLAGLTAGTTYYYIVTAVNSAGESTASAQVSATTEAPPAVIPTPVPTPTPSNTDGADLYTIDCAACHGPLATSSIWGSTADVIQAVIISGGGGMSSLTSLTITQFQAIAAALTPTWTLYNQYCYSCHGTTKQGNSSAIIQYYISNNTGGMGSLSYLTAAQITAIAAGH